MTIYAITDRVLEYINHGFAPIPIGFQTKSPINRNWPELAISAANIGNYFSCDPINIGILTGERSGGLIDIDIDNNDALRFADRFLPRTNCIFGRASKPRSHRIYRVSDAGRRETFEAANGMIAEIRGNGCCTVFPGSVHPTGEPIEFDNSDEFTPGSSTWRELKTAVQSIAFGTVLSEKWSSGHRHDLALSTTAFLAREGWNSEDVTNLIEAVASEVHDEELNDRLVCVQTTFEKHGLGQAISSDNGLIALIGADVFQNIKRWLSGEKYNVTVSMKGRHLDQVADLSSDASAADAFAAAFSDRVIYSKESWYRKTVQVFEPITDALVQGLAKDFTQTQTASYGASLMMKSCLSRARINATVELSRSRFHVDPKLMDAEPDLVGCADGTILNLSSDDRQISKALITKKLGVSVEANTSCPRWLAFLNRIFDGDRALIAFIQRAVGYTLTGSCEEQCLFILTGTGGNGKSKFLGTLQALFGDYAASVPMQSLMEQKYAQQTNDLAHLLGKRLVTASEGEKGQKLAESKVKLMTGGDRIVCRQLYRDFIEFLPQFKLWVMTNDLPTIVGTDEAIWRRIMLIPFSVTIPDDEQDKTLGTRLAAELPGIFNWAFEGWKLWRDGGLKPPPRVVQSTGTYRTDNDSVGQWIAAACVEGSGLSTSMKALHASYHSWCENSGFEPLTSSCLSKELGRRKFDQMRTSTGNGRRGIGLKQPIASYP